MERNDGSDDPLDATFLGAMCHDLQKAADRLGRPINLAERYMDMMLQAGFVDVQQSIYKWPVNQLSTKNPYEYDLGCRNLTSLWGGVESLTLRLFTRGLGRSANQVVDFCRYVRNEMPFRNYHASWAV